MTVVLIFPLARFTAIWWPLKSGAASATITSNFRVLAAFLRNLSTVLDLPMVRMISLAWM